MKYDMSFIDKKTFQLIKMKDYYFDTIHKNNLK